VELVSSNNFLVSTKTALDTYNTKISTLQNSGANTGASSVLRDSLSFFCSKTEVLRTFNLSVFSSSQLALFLYA
jgi:hypothetical protein